MPKSKTKKTAKSKKKVSRAKKTVKKKVKKEAVKKKIVKKETSQKIDKKPKYFEAVGRRKAAVARVRLFTSGKKEILVNGRAYKSYFPISFLQRTIEAPLEKLNCLDKFAVFVKVRGGGLSAQAEASRHGISRALVLLNPYFKKRLRKAGFLTRDSRVRERKKFGLKRARRAPQWSKR